MLARITSHLRAHAVAYVALGFSLSGGGIGAAVAATATSSTAIHACVDKRTGALYVLKRCTRSEHRLIFNQQGPTGAAGAPGSTGPAGPAGTPAVVAFGKVNSPSNLVAYQGLTITNPSTGTYDFTVTANCPHDAIIPVASPVGLAPSDQKDPPIVRIANIGVTNTFTVQAGSLQNGSFVLDDQPFSVLVECQ